MHPWLRVEPSGQVGLLEVGEEQLRALAEEEPVQAPDLSAKPRAAQRFLSRYREVGDLGVERLGPPTESASSLEEVTDRLEQKLALREIVQDLAVEPGEKEPDPADAEARRLVEQDSSSGIPELLGLI